MATRASDRLRALVVTPDFPPAFGGIQLLMHRLVEHWQHVDACVVTFQEPGAQEFDRRTGLSTRRVRRPRGGGRVPAVVMLDGHAVAAARRLGADVMLSAHVVAGLAGAGARRLLGVPYVQYLHGKEVVARPAVTRFAIRHAAAVVAVSRHTEELALRHGARADLLHRVPNGVDLPSSVSLNEARADRPTIVTVARLEDRYKGHDVLLRALPLVRAQVPGAHLVVVGDGSLRPVYESLARSLGVGEGVTFAGSVDDETRDRLLGSAHVFTMPSRLPVDGGGEGFGIVYLEAAVRGVPSVAGNVGGAVDAVVHEETGLLVDPTDHVAVAAAIARLLRDPAEAERLGRAAAARAREFTWPLVARRVEDILLDVARARR